GVFQGVSGRGLGLGGEAGGGLDGEGDRAYQDPGGLILSSPIGIMGVIAWSTLANPYFPLGCSRAGRYGPIEGIVDFVIPIPGTDVFPGRPAVLGKGDVNSLRVILLGRPFNCQYLAHG